MTLSLERIGSFASEFGAEIIAYDAPRELLYVVSGDTVIEVLDLSDPSAPSQVAAVDIADFGAPVAGANSIAYKDGLLAVALEAENQTDNGVVALVDIEQAIAADDVLDAVQVFVVGALPDMVTFTPDGTKVLVANEGEPDTVENADGSESVVDPDGSVSIIDVSGDFASLSQDNIATADFSQFNGQEDDLRAAGVRIFPDATTAQDVEPEYIAVSPDGTKAFVTLQEANAIAIVDIATATIESIEPLGLKDFSQSGLDASDRDEAINIQSQPVFGLYMPDSIASFESNGEAFYVIANEGDDRGDADEDARGDAIRLKDLGDVTSFGREGLSLDESFDESLLEDEALGRLTVSSIDGDTDGDGDIDQIVSYGGRSFSVLDSSGNIVFDSGDQIAQITAELNPELFNANNGDPEDFDTRSDNKGAEPEAITTGVIDGKPYAFVGLERAGGGVLVYELSDPEAPEFVQYIRSDEDIAPEGLAFISAEDSPSGKPLLSVANEVSNTVAIYEVEVPVENFTLEILHAADQEGGVAALDDAPNFSAVLNALEAEDIDGDGDAFNDNTIKLSSGDAFIPGLVYEASEETLGGAGRADILIQNELGFDAIALGNHEFDNGTAELAGLIASVEDDPSTPDVDESYEGTAFPYLSSNLDFSTDPNLAPLVVEDAQAPQGNSIAASTVVDVNG